MLRVLVSYGIGEGVDDQDAPPAQHYFSFGSVLGKDKVARYGDEVRYALEKRQGREAAMRVMVEQLQGAQ